jgi:hypothetical protein
MPFFTRTTLKDAFELLLSQKIVGSEFRKVSRRINRLKENDWRLWFGRFLLFVRSDAENYRFTDACICLAEAENLAAKNPEDKKELESLLDRETLFLVFKFYYDATGITPLALLLARAYQNGWGVKVDIEKALEYAKIAAETKDSDPIYLIAQEVLNSILLQVSK